MTVDEFRRALASRVRRSRTRRTRSQKPSVSIARTKLLAATTRTRTGISGSWTWTVSRVLAWRPQISAEIERMRRTGDINDLHPDLANHDSHLRAYAFRNLDLTRVPGQRTPPADGLAEIGVIIDAETLGHGAHDHSLCELTDGYPFPIETARRLACTAGMYPIVLNGAGLALDVGFEQTARHQDPTACVAWACTAPVVGPGVMCRSTSVRSITSTGGRTAGRRTSRTLFPCAVAITTSSTRAGSESRSTTPALCTSTRHTASCTPANRSASPQRLQTRQTPAGAPPGRPPDPDRPPGAPPDDPGGPPTAGPAGEQLVLVA